MHVVFSGPRGKIRKEALWVSPNTVEESFVTIDAVAIDDQSICQSVWFPMICTSPRYNAASRVNTEMRCYKTPVFVASPELTIIVLSSSYRM